MKKTFLNFTLSNGSNKYKNANGFAYAKFEIEKQPSFGCYPTNENFSDSFENGDCAISNCFNNCENAAGKAKLYLFGYLKY